MEQFTEEHSKYLLGKEWLAKTNNNTSTLYLIKFHCSNVDLSCWVLLTDTKSVWAEVLNGNQLARRWRNCRSAPSTNFSDDGEEAWRATTVELLSNAHTIGGMAEASFNVVHSKFSDLAFELQWDAFKWRWETCFLGYRASADILSQHLIFPLISFGHLACSYPESFSSTPDIAVEKDVDKLGRTARTTVDTHAKNAFSRPRLASTLRRITAVFNFVSDLPPIISNTEVPDLVVTLPPERASPTSSQLSSKVPHNPTLSPVQETLYPSRNGKDKAGPWQASRGDSSEINACNSATESESDGYILSEKNRLSVLATKDTPSPSRSRTSTRDPLSNSGSSPGRPPKKIKLSTSPSDSDSDSETERKRRLISLLKSRNRASGVNRGTKQPIKHGGRRF